MHRQKSAESFDEKSSDSFGKEYMTKLFNAGYQMAVDGHQWNSVPPGYDRSGR
jgi:hypothetical protein